MNEEKKLTDEEIVKDIERSTGMPSYWKKIVLDLIHRLQDENERLTEELKEEKVWYSELYQSKAELQEQVDELLNRRIEPKIFQCHADTLETCPKVEQAVKDTAKEILTKIDCLYNAQDLGLAILDFSHWIEERYGVEVE